MEPQVLQQDDLPIRRAVDYLLDLLADAVLDEAHGAAQQSLQLGHDGSQAVFGVGLAVGTAQVGHENDGLGAIVQGILDRRQRARDPLVVGHFLVLIERDVEVDLFGWRCPRVNGCKFFLLNRLAMRRLLTRIRTRWPLRSTSVMASLLERDMVSAGSQRLVWLAGSFELTRTLQRKN